MANVFLEPIADFSDQIRAAINLDLLTDVASDDDEVLPDSVIEMPIYLGVAESLVLARFPQSIDYTGTQLTRVQNALIYYTAALLLPAIPFYIRENFGDYSYTRPEIDLARLANALKLRANNELGGIADDYLIPTLFTTAEGYRGY